MIGHIVAQGQVHTASGCYPVNAIFYSHHGVFWEILHLPVYLILLGEQSLALETDQTRLWPRHWPVKQTKICERLSNTYLQLRHITKDNRQVDI